MKLDLGRFTGLTSRPKLSEEDQVKLLGDPLFTKQEAAEGPSHLDRILRKYIVKNNITDSFFKRCCRRVVVEFLRQPERDTSTYMGNLLRPIKRGYTTYNRFEETFEHVLNVKIKKVTIEVETPDGRTEVYDSIPEDDNHPGF